MDERPRVRPTSRKAWREWLQKHHGSSAGVWVVYAKTHTGLPSLTYNDAVEEALCFGWIDSRINPIDDDLYMQIFTPRKPKSAWSALNKTRVERMVAARLMAPAGRAAIDAAKQSGAWDMWKAVDALTVPPDLEKAIAANADARRNWAFYSASRRKGALYRLASARRPETRAKYLREIVENMARNMSDAERRERAGFRPKAKPARPAKR